MNLSARIVDVYPYRPAGGGIEMLVLRRSSGRMYAGQWRMVGGKVEPGEAAWQAARRELGEETGCEPLRFWSLPSVNAFYEWSSDRINLAPAFGAELVAGAEPRLDDEHDDFAWLPPEEAVNRLVWPEQKRLAMLCARLATEDAIAPEWLVG